MDINTEISDEYAMRRGNAVLSYLLECVRKGNRSEIENKLSSSELLSYTKLIFNNELSFTYMVVQFLWPQIVRAAVDGGMLDMEASGIYRGYMLKAKYASSVQSLLELHHQVFLEYASKVAIAQVDLQFSTLVRKCRHFIKEHLFEPLTVSHIAKALYISRSHLTHQYKKETGESITDLIRREKINESKQLLKHSELSLNEIGQQLGFSSQSHFTEIFRKETGTTPRRFRDINV